MRSSSAGRLCLPVGADVAQKQPHRSTVDPGIGVIANLAREGTVGTGQLHQDPARAQRRALAPRRVHFDWNPAVGNCLPASGNQFILHPLLAGHIVRLHRLRKRGEQMVPGWTREAEAHNPLPLPERIAISAQARAANFQPRFVDGCNRLRQSLRHRLPLCLAEPAGKHLHGIHCFGTHQSQTLK